MAAGTQRELAAISAANELPGLAQVAVDIATDGKVDASTRIQAIHCVILIAQIDEVDTDIGG
jgi:hypothetical protein